MWIMWPGRMPEGEEYPWAEERRLSISTTEVIVLFLK
jgi:hypothetical protein